MIVAIIGIFAVAFGGYYFGVQYKQNDNTSVKSSNASTELDAKEDGNKNVTSDETNVAGVVSKASESVVSITALTNSSSRFSNSSGSSGTGIIISENGYILTNKHVVKGMKRYQVVTSNDKVYSNVSLVGVDPNNDLAVLKIKDASGLKPATFGDSSTIRIGQRVVAIGNSLGYQNTVTDGIVSGLNRPIEAGSENSSEVERLTGLLQTDAAINPGNSGGPLLNMSGQVLGINTAIASNANGMGFAIPINSVKGIVKTVLKTGEIDKAYLGVQYVDINADIAEAYKLPVKRGAYIRTSSGLAVQKNSPADKAEIKEGDIITKVNGQEVGGSGGGVSDLVSQYVPGDKIKLSVLRDGKEITKAITLGSYPKSSFKNTEDY